MSTHQKNPINKVNVHPLVLLSVVDHYNRVTKGANFRVGGILLGSIRKGIVEVKNSFAVPFEEDSQDSTVWFFDQNYIEDMYGMCRKVTSKEVIVGWYTTGPGIKTCDIEIHQLLKKYLKFPVYVIINVKVDEKRKQLPTKAYICIEEFLEKSEEPKLSFGHIDSEITSLEAEEIGVEHLLRGVKDSTVSDLNECVERRLKSVDEFEERLAKIVEYLDNVIKGDMDINHQILYILQDVFNKLPSLKIEGVRDAFIEKTNNKMVVMFMSNVYRAILALHDLINNKLEIREKEKKEKERELKIKEEKKKEKENKEKEEKEKKILEKKKKEEEEKKKKEKQDTMEIDG